jgi:hypothetical protein
VVTVPGGTKELVTESENENILNHLLAQIMIDTEDFLFLPVGLQSLLQFPRASEILAEWFLDLLSWSAIFMDSKNDKAAHNNSRNAFLGIAVSLQLI